MAVDLYSYSDHHHHHEEEEDDYIDMEVTSYSDIYCHTNPLSSSSYLPPHDPRGDFEFHMSLNSIERDQTTTSPADELFYKGKLLPLHLPPRLQMVEKLLSSTLTSSQPFHTTIEDKISFDETYRTPLNTNTATTPLNGASPFESCNVSPAASCQVSKELNLEEYLAEYSCNDRERIDYQHMECDDNRPTAIVAPVGKKSWTRKLKLIKQSSTIGSKLKASRSYLKSLFGKPGCSYESSSSSAAAAGVAKSKDAMIGGGLLSSSGRVQDLNKGNKKYPFGQIAQQISTTNLDQDDSNNHNKEDRVGRDGKIKHRRSFSGAFTGRSAMNNKLSSPSSSSGSSSSLSSSSSSNSATNNNSSDQLPAFRRSSSASNSEFESPIQGAIAHCKKSQAQKQLLIKTRKTMSEVGFYSLSSSRLTLPCD